MDASGRVDVGLKTLLELDGEMYPMDNGYWTQFKAKRVVQNQHVPHGIDYSLTLHDRNNRRILGYDNAHRAMRKRNKYAAKRIEWDHKHERAKVSDYEFENAGQLLDDFWKDVNRILCEIQRRKWLPK